MKTNVLWSLAGSAGLLAAVALTGAAVAGEPLRVLVVTGGHPYDTNQFRAVFESMPGIEPRFVVQPDAQAWWAPERAKEWDVMVLYDMWQPITAEAKRNFRRCLEEGKGLVATHHSLANYQDWPLYAEIIGGRYHLDPWEEDGVPQPASTYKHDVDLEVQVLNPRHPVTRGMADFTIHDEAYGKLEIKPAAKPLLAVRHPESSPLVAWTRYWKGARVVTIQLGHDRQAYANESYRRLLLNAIRWVGRR
ncbi:MAG: ThuA domain-containing protein [Verrucomicrobia bacterium]|nr:MAG: ThuA domain-containing protein [Verrucomicrobiota bacterium]